MIFLPPYCPELNPIERFWHVLKEKVAWLVFDTLQPLKDRVQALLEGFSPAIQSLEDVHNQRDLDFSFESVTRGVRELLWSANLAKAQLPKPKPADRLRFAAIAFLYLWRYYGHAILSLYDKGQAVHEFNRVLEMAGILLSIEAVRNHLSEALKKNDSDGWCLPHEFREVVSGLGWGL